MEDLVGTYYIVYKDREDGRVLATCLNNNVVVCSPNRESGIRYFPRYGYSQIRIPLPTQGTKTGPVSGQDRRLCCHLQS